MNSMFEFQPYVENSNLPRGIKRELNTLFGSNLDKSFGRPHLMGAPIDLKVQAAQATNLIAILCELRKAKFEITSVYKIKEKHVEFLIQKWVDEDQKRQVIERKIACIRLLGFWTRRPNVIKKLHQYPILDRLFGEPDFEEEDSLWQASGFSVDGVIEEALLEDVFIGTQLKLMIILGLDIADALLVRPLEPLIHEGNFFYVTLENGKKSGRRYKVQSFNFDFESKVLDDAKAFVNGKSNTLIPSEYTLKEWTSRFNSVLEKLGIQKTGKFGVSAMGLRRHYLKTLDGKKGVAKH